MPKSRSSRSSVATGFGTFPPPACCTARATHGGTPAPPGSRTRGGSVVARKCYKGKSTPLVTACASKSLCAAPEAASSECMSSARRCPRVFFPDFACSVPSTSLHPAAPQLHSLRRKDEGRHLQPLWRTDKGGNSLAHLLHGLPEKIRKHTSLCRKGSGTISSSCSTATGEAIDRFPASKKEEK